MRILHLSWEYPPVVYGGLGRHVHALAHAQAANGHDVLVITQAYGPADHGDEDDAGPRRLEATADGGVRVVRAGGLTAEREHDLLGQVERMQTAFAASGAALRGLWTPDVIHAHDWMVGSAAAALRRATGAPLVATIHATEAGRNRGWITTELSTSIHGLEWWLANTADALIVCSHHMAGEVGTLFGVEPTAVIANGIDPAEWRATPQSARQVRADNADATSLLAYVGRVEWEKGVQTILEALPLVQGRHQGVRLLVAGRGSYLPALQAQASAMGLGEAARFLGWVSEAHLRAIVAAADVAIVPSLYEPFGLVALEATALGAPVIVARTGGLAEFAEDGRYAATFVPGDPQSLAQAITGDLDDPAGAADRARRAGAVVTERYAWRDLARTTVGVYAGAISASAAPPQAPGHDPAAARRDLGVPHFVAPLGRLMDVGW